MMDIDHPASEATEGPMAAIKTLKVLILAESVLETELDRAKKDAAISECCMSACSAKLY